MLDGRRHRLKLAPLGVGGAPVSRTRGKLVSRPGEPVVTFRGKLLLPGVLDVC